MKKLTRDLFEIFLLTIAFVSLADAQISTGGNYSLAQTAIANGGASGATASVNGTYTIEGSIGQSTAGTTEQASSYKFQPGFWHAATVFGPTAATVNLAGRVTTAGGRGILNVRLTITNQNGTSRSILTSSFGYFRFEDIEVGQTYVIQINSKRYQFGNDTQIISVNDEITDLLFTALPD